MGLDSGFQDLAFGVKVLWGQECQAKSFMFVFRSAVQDARDVRA